MADSDITENEPNYECDECGNAFHANENDTAPFSCPNCKSDNASPLNG
jgi:Zn finger protein HypA/HybF involved in hydrogenase expression